MKSVNHKQLGKLIKEAYKKKRALFIWGGIGIGKSDIVKEVAKQIAKDKGFIYNDDMTKISEKNVFSVIDIRLSQMDLSDIRGLPKYEEKTETTKWYAPNFLPKNGQGILFFDELNLALPTIQATAYQLILNRRIGNDYILPEGWVIVSAGNRLTDRANIFETPAPLNNRFMHIELDVPNVDQWLDWAVANGVDTRISTYLKFEPVLYKFEKNMNDKAFPSPRSWFFASEMIKDKDSKDLETIEILVASCVGEATAMKFTAWLKLMEKVDINEILKNPLEAKLPKELDLLYATISGILEHYKNDKKLMNPILQIATRLTPEFAVLLLKLVKTHTPNFTKQVYALPAWKENAKKLQPYFRKEDGETDEDD